MNRLKRGHVLLPNARLSVPEWSSLDIELSKNKRTILRVGVACRTALYPAAPRFSFNHYCTVYRDRPLVALQLEVADVLSQCWQRRVKVPGLPPLEKLLPSKKSVIEGLSLGG